ncbi:MAG: hypothetical protein IPN37_09385, partial [Betaproteobacteria bacterium]|nr:hypothetical protein [Betaproteobacteria bacterium]
SLRLISPLFAAVAGAGATPASRSSGFMRPEVARMAPFIPLSSLLSYFASALMFDSLLSLVALGLVGNGRAWKSGGGACGFLAAGAKHGRCPVREGPVARGTCCCWRCSRRGGCYASSGSALGPLVVAGVALALLGGAALILVWAIPAAWAGGEAYRNAIFWARRPHRMVDSFAHRAPAWFYRLAAADVGTPRGYCAGGAIGGLAGALRPDSGVSGWRQLGTLFCLAFFLAQRKRALPAAAGVHAVRAAGRARC